MSRTMAVHVRYKFLYIFFAVLCKTTTQNYQTLRCLENGNFLKFYIKFIAVSQIQLCDSFDSDR